MEHPIRYTLTAVARLTGYGRKTLVRLVDKGKIPTVRAEGTGMHYCLLEDVEKAFQSSATPPISTGDWAAMKARLNEIANKFMAKEVGSSSPRKKNSARECAPQ